MRIPSACGRHRQGLFLIVLALAVRASSVGAQPAPTSAPDVFTEFVARMVTGRFRDAATLLYLPPLEERRLQAIVGARTQRRYVPTLADITRGDPEMPPAVAEYQLAQIRKHMAEAAEVGFEDEWFGVKDTIDLGRLTPAEAAERWLQARDQRRRMQMMWNRTPGCRGRPFVVDSLATFFRPSVVGVVQRGDTAWALYRIGGGADGDFAMELPPTVAPLIRHGDRWYVWPAMTLLRGDGFMAISCDSMPR